MTFDWTHSYGPLDWPRDGTTLLNVKSDRPHYWKARCSTASTASAGCARLPSDTDRRAPRAADRRARAATGPTSSATRAGTSRSGSRSARSRASCSLAPGITHRGGRGRHDVQFAATARDPRSDDPLERGDSYTVRAYAPDPTPGPDARAPARRTPDDAAPVHRDGAARAPGRARSDGVGRLGTRRASRRRRCRCRCAAPPGNSTPARTAPTAAARLALRAGVRPGPPAHGRTRPTAYDAVKAVESHLQRNYRYSERAAERRRSRSRPSCSRTGSATASSSRVRWR